MFTSCQDTMSKPDYRYLQAWARPSASTRAPRPYENRSTYEVILPTTDGDTATTPSAPVTKTASSDSTVEAAGYQVRLDTPGGFTYAPDMLAQHNSVKRLFIPGTVLEQRNNATEYDFGKEIRDRNPHLAAPQQSAQPSSASTDQGVTEAQAYIDSIRDRPDVDIKPFDIPGADLDPASPAPSTVKDDHADTTSILTNATATSVQTSLTAMTLASGRSQTLPRNVIANAVVAPFRAAPAVSGDKSHAQTPWSSGATRSSHRALDRPSDQERAAGITQFEQATEGRIPSSYEASMFATPSSDSATIQTVRSGELRVEDLFIPDPRPWRPLRWVRKVDPRQMLILCAGAALTPGQIAATKYGKDSASLHASQHPMLGISSMPDYKTLESQLKTSSAASAEGTEDKRVGLGFVFCPHSDPRNADKKRHEPNFSRRLERPTEFAQSTLRRGALRSALAALEFTRWEAEGFDKIVIGTHHSWLVDGIARWIWEWRHTSWKLNAESPLGMVGDQVPDRDLWELLDRAVKSYEEIDCTVRFWKLSKDQNAAAVDMAKEGACKDTVHPGTVRWTKKKTQPFAQGE